VDLILHAGTGKTGTTSIQLFLHVNRAALARHGVLFPSTPGRQRHVRFTMFVTPDDELVGSRPARKLAQDPTWGDLIAESPNTFRSAFQDAFLREIQESALSRVLLSDESLFRSTVPSMQMIAAFKRRHVGSLRLVCYLRRQDDHLISRYQQAVKHGEVRRLVDRTEQLHLARSYDYAGQLDNWSRIVAPTDIVVRRFSRPHFLNGSLIEDFLHAAGIEVPVDVLAAAPRMNDSLDVESVEFLRILNLFLADHPRAANTVNRRRILKRLRGASRGPQLSLPEPVLDRFMAQWMPGNRVVANRYLGIDEDLFPWPRKANTTTHQYLDPSRLDHFLEVSGVPARLHAPLRRLVEREAAATQ
jgi:hypothetical protein